MNWISRQWAGLSEIEVPQDISVLEFESASYLVSGHSIAALSRSADIRFYVMLHFAQMSATGKFVRRSIDWHNVDKVPDAIFRIEDTRFGILPTVKFRSGWSAHDLVHVSGSDV